MNKYLVSILIPLYNAEKYIEECLDSIISQNANNVELIILDDGSTDDSLRIVKEKTASYEWIHIITQENQNNIYQVRKKLILSAKGKYVLFVDADDILAENSLEILFGEIKYKKSDIIMFNYCIKSAQGVQKSNYDYAKDFEGDNLIEKYYEHLFLDNKYNALWSKCFKRELFFDNNLFCNYNISMGEDLILCLVAGLKTKSISILDKVLYFYRIEGQGISNVYKFMYYYNFSLIYQFMIFAVNEADLNDKFRIYAAQYYLTMIAKFYLLVPTKCKEDKLLYEQMLKTMKEDKNYLNCYQNVKNLSLFYRIVNYCIKKNKKNTLLILNKLARIVKG